MNVLLTRQWGRRRWPGGRRMWHARTPKYAPARQRVECIEFAAIVTIMWLRVWGSMRTRPLFNPTVAMHAGAAPHMRNLHAVLHLNEPLLFIYAQSWLTLLMQPDPMQCCPLPTLLAAQPASCKTNPRLFYTLAVVPGQQALAPPHLPSHVSWALTHAAATQLLPPAAAAQLLPPLPPLPPPPPLLLQLPPPPPLLPSWHQSASCRAS
jgi:hypothetical protein